MQIGVDGCHLLTRARLQPAYPLRNALQLRAVAAIFAGATFRNEFDQLAFKGNASADVEKSHEDEKYLWHNPEDLPMGLVANVASTIHAMDVEEASISLKRAKITDPTTAITVRNIVNGSKHKPAPKPAAAPSAGAAGGSNAKAVSRKGKATVAVAVATPLSPVSIMSARGGAGLPRPAVGEAPEQQWGRGRGAPVVSAAARSVAAAADAPVAAPTLAQMIASSRTRVAPAAAALHEVTEEEVTLVVNRLRRLPQVGHRGAASQVAAAAAAGDTVIQAKRNLLEALQSFRAKAQIAADTTVAEATKAGYVAPHAGAPMPLGRGRGAALQRR